MSPTPRHMALGVFVAAALALTSEPARAGVMAIGVEPFAGAVSLDPHLADYQWDAGTHPVWGLGLRADGPFLAAGARFWSTGATQDASLPGDILELDVGLRAAEAFGEVRIASVAGFRLGAAARGGVLRIAWSPDRLDVTGSGPDPVVVAFDPVHETIWGAGLAIRRGLPAGLDVAVGIDRSWFRLDTAHRRGAEIVNDRETFASWMTTLAVSRRIFSSP